MSDAMVAVSSTPAFLEWAIAPPPPIASAHASVADAIALMHAAQATSDLPSRSTDLQTVSNQASADCVLVMAEKDLVGLLTERDVIRLLASGSQCFHQSLADSMTSPVITLQKSAFTDIAAALELMQHHRIRHLPVVDEQGQVTGLLTYETLCQPAILQAMAAQKSLNAAEHTEQQRMEQEIRLLYTITRAISMVEDFDTALEIILRQICQFTHWSLGEAWIPSADQTYLHLSPSWYCDDPSLHRFRETSLSLTIAPHVDLAGHVWVTQQPEWDPNLSEQTTEQFLRLEAAQACGLKSAFAVPIVANDGVVAVLILFSTQYRELDAFLLQLITSVTTRLGQIVRQKRTEAALQQLNQQLETKIAERTAALRESEERLRQIFEQSPVGIAISDLEGRLIRVNSSLAAIMECAPSELLQQSIQTLFSGSQVQNNPFEQLLEHTLSVVSIEQEAVNKYDEKLWLNITSALIFNAFGRPSTILHLIEDISDRKRSELLLQSQTEFLRQLINTIPQLIFVKDWDGRFTLINQAVATLYGTTIENLIGKTDADFNPNLAEVEQFLIHDRQVMTTLQTRIIEETVTTAGGEQRYFQTIKTPIVMADGQSREVLGVATDITDRRLAELDLQESETKLRLFIEYAPAAVAMFDRQMHYIAVSHRWRQDYALGDQHLIGHNHYDLFPTLPQRWKDVHQRCLAGAVEICDEDTLIRGDGSLEWIRWEVRPWNRPDGSIGGIVMLTEVITARKQVEEQLRNLSDRLTLAMQSGAIGIWEWDAVRNHMVWDDRMYELYGIQPSDFACTYEAWLNRLHPDDQPTVKADIEQALQGKKDYDTEFRVIYPDGTIRFLKANGLLQCNEQGNPRRMIGINFDITERKHAEEKLARYAREVEDLYNNAPCGYHSLDADGRFMQINDTALDWLGYRREEVLGKAFVDFLPERDRPLFLTHYAQFKQRRSVKDLEYDLICKDGTLFPVLVSATAVTNPDGTYLCSRSTSFDIRERKAAEKVLSRQLAAIEAAIDGIALLQDGIYTYLNQAHLNLFGYHHADELIGKSWQELYLPEELSRFEQEIFPLVMQQGFWQGEAQATRKDGTRFVQGLSLTLMENGELICVCRDITAQKQVEKNLQQINERLTLTNAELDRATRLKDEFLANMSHELRTPLNAILGMSEGFQEEIFGPLNARQKRAIGTIENSGKHLLELINDILDLSKVEAGKLELQPDSVAITYLCESSLTFIKQQALKKNLQLIAEVPQGLPNIVVDERRIRQVLINLLSNAVKFTPDGGTVKLLTQLESHSDQNFLCFSVVDTGIGIAPEDVGRLFKPFVQIDSSLNRRYSGTGLGLALVRRLVELHKGTVTATSTLGQGSCFTVRLPYGVYGRDIPSLPIPPSTHLNFSPENSNVLLVEDSSAAAEQVSRYLHELGMQATVCDRGEKVVDEALRLQPTLIILDIQLPNLSGWEVLHQLKSTPQTQTIPVIMVSVVDERSRGLAAGASEYLVKPISRDRFRSALAKICQPDAPSILLQQLSPEAPTVAPLILLAEDNEVNAMMISSYLTARGYRLIHVLNGQEAITAVKTQCPDLVLMDIQMPEVNGLEAIHQIRSDPQVAHTPIIALTALAMMGDREKCLEAGANDYFAKPVKLKQLVEMIQTLLESG